MTHHRDPSCTSSTAGWSSSTRSRPLIRSGFSTSGTGNSNGPSSRPEARPAPQTARPSAAPEPRLALEPIEFDSSNAGPGRAQKPPLGATKRAATGSAPLDFVRQPSRLARSTLTNPCVHTEDLDRFAQRRDRRYLDELTRLFASGDVKRALRRAIPLNGEGERGARFAHRWGTREHLRISPNRPRPAAVVDVEAGLQGDLEQRYRSAVSQLSGKDGSWMPVRPRRPPEPHG